MKEFNCAVRRIKPLKQIILKFRNLRLFYKLLALNLLLLITYGAICFASLKISFLIYDNELYQKTSEVMTQFSIGFENDMKDVEKFSLDVALDETVQKQLSEIADSNDPYDYLVKTDYLKTKLMMKPMLRQTIATTGYIDPNSKTFSVGENTDEITQEIKEELLEKAKEEKGLRDKTGGLCRRIICCAAAAEAGYSSYPRYLRKRSHCSGCRCRCGFPIWPSGSACRWV